MDVLGVGADSFLAQLIAFVVVSVVGIFAFLFPYYLFKFFFYYILNNYIDIVGSSIGSE